MKNTFATFAAAATLMIAPSAFAADAETQRLSETCASTTSSASAVMACTKLMRSASDADERGAYAAQRGLHRLAMGNYKTAAADFRHAGEITSDDGLYTLGEGFAAVASSDANTARLRFEDCRTQGSLAPYAHYGLGVAHKMAGRDSDARENFELALSFSPDWTPAQAGMRSLS